MGASIEVCGVHFTSAQVWFIVVIWVVVLPFASGFGKAAYRSWRESQNDAV